MNDSGNFSMLDILHLLGWVQQNARAFGGDPNRVTVGGYSAGGGYTWAMLTSPAAQGRNLFHRAVIQSGPLGVWPVTAAQNTETSRRLLAQALYQRDSSLSFLAASTLATQHHLTGESGPVLRSFDPVMLLCLVNRKRAAEWPDQCGELWPLPPGVNSSFQFPPTNDGVVQPLISQAQAVQLGDFAQVPIIIGATQQESKYFTVLFEMSLDEATRQHQGLPSDQQYHTLFSQFDPDHPTQSLPGIGVPTVEFLLPNGRTPQEYEVTQGFLSGITTREMVDRGAKAARSHVPVYAYQFRWQHQPKPFATILGATHTIDHPFWLQTFAENGNDYEMQPVGFSQENAAGRVDLAQQMGVLFRNFLCNGDPNLGEAPPTRWRPWRTLAFDRRLILDASDRTAQLQMGR